MGERAREDDCEAATSEKHEQLHASDLLAAYSDEEQKRAVRKLDWNMITL